MPDQSCPHQEQSADYVLGLLQGAELAHFHAHQDECPACRLAVQELSGVVDLLAFAPVPVAPPPALKQRILDKLSRTPQDLPAVRVEQDHRRPPAVQRLPMWAAAAMLVMAVGLTGLGWQVSKVSGELADLQVQHRMLVASEGSEMTVRRVSLSGTEAAPEAQGMILFVPAREGVQVVLRATGLDEVSGQQVYHLWMVKDGQRLSGGTFVSDPRGWAVHTHWFPETEEWDAVGITLEPDPAPLPRGQKVLGGSL